MVITVEEAVEKINCPGNGQVDIPLYQIDLVEWDGDPASGDIWVNITLK